MPGLEAVLLLLLMEQIPAKLRHNPGLRLVARDMNDHIRQERLVTNTVHVHRKEINVASGVDSVAIPVVRRCAVSPLTMRLFRLPVSSHYLTRTFVHRRIPLDLDKVS